MAVQKQEEEAVLEEKISVSTRHGEVIKKNGIQYFITVHPAAALRFTKNEKYAFRRF